MIRSACAFALTAILCAPAPAADWPQFRGPAGSGVADDQKPPVKFGPKDNLAWKVPVPPGASSPIVVGDKIVLTAFEDGKLFTICYSRTDGKELWRADAKAKKIEEFHPTEGSPAASTPASDGKKVVVYFGSCGLICYDLDGKEQWTFELPTAETDGRFGSGTSPVIADGLVLLARDLSKDRRCTRSTSPMARGSGRPSGPNAHRVRHAGGVDDGGRRCSPSPAQTLTGYDAKTGAEVWTVDKLPSGSCATPILFKDTLVYAAWSPGGGDFKMPAFDDILKEAGEEKLGHLTKAGSAKTMLKDFFDNNDTNKDGKLTRQEWDANIKMMEGGENRAVALKPGGKGEVAWSYTKNLPFVPSPIVYRDRLYMLKDGPLMTCLDAKTGKPVYEAERLKAGAKYYASPVAANGNIYLFALDGTAAVVAAGEDAPDVAHSVKLAEGVRATPAIAHNTLYMRSDKFLYAFTEKK